MPKTLSSSVKIFYPTYKRPELVEILQERLFRLISVLPLKRVVLFGSWAMGRETAFSDIDLMVTYVGQPREEAYRLVKRHLNLRGLEPHVFCEEEAQELAVTIERMTKQGIVLYPN